MDDQRDLTARVRDGYDRIAAEYDEQRSTDDTDVSLVERFRDALGANAAVLDAGCGTGTPVTALLAEECTVTGLDLSREQLSLATDRLPAHSFVEGEMTRLPFAEDSFDGLTSFYAVIHVPRERHEDAFSEFHRVCRPGAPVLCTVGDTDWAGHNEDWMGMGGPMYWDIPGLDRTRKLLDDAGFSVEGVDRVMDDVADEPAKKPFVWARA
ncbi:class I SAM-dependent methyltransferase [Halorhabdus sp. CBA1104]|uniref:class I SAM-dependent methyltransferase n=1 Tax=unclassified Halorhabdus TaxID=2621901 RepID=UPI0012B2435D|nr:MULTISPECIES: class I SAM-dependent methyltransferase [unclassified Halorhabdus]QGN07558.1 class I SAM-dependent methyltransferase [Halorhabdus sp. CBA1104]